MKRTKKPTIIIHLQPTHLTNLKPKKLNRTPHHGQLPILDDTIKKAQEKVMRQLQKYPYVNRNISGSKWQALKSLRDNDNIVMKQVVELTGRWRWKSSIVAIFLLFLIH